MLTRLTRRVRDAAETGVRMHMLLRDRPSARRVAEEGMREAAKHGFPLQRDALAFVAAWAAPTRDVDAMRAEVEAARRQGTRLLVAGHMAVVAEALVAAGRPADAGAEIAEALALVEEAGERWYERRASTGSAPAARGPRWPTCAAGSPSCRFADLDDARALLAGL